MIKMYSTKCEPQIIKEYTTCIDSGLLKSNYKSRSEMDELCSFLINEINRIRNARINIRKKYPNLY